MSRVTRTVEMTVDQPGVYHIPGVHNMQQTLCGYVDAFGAVDHLPEEHPCDCRSCISALEAIKALRFPGYYFTTGEKK